MSAILELLLNGLVFRLTLLQWFNIDDNAEQYFPVVVAVVGSGLV